MLQSRLFTWIQGADFYRNLHAEAVSHIPVGDGLARWVDIGCGPGLVTRLAAARGYQAWGIDVDTHMIAAAQRIARRENSPAEFVAGGLDTIPEDAQVVSAASLLAVLPDSAAGLSRLWRSVAPNGYLLIIEASASVGSRARSKCCEATSRLILLGAGATREKRINDGFLTV